MRDPNGTDHRYRSKPWTLVGVGCFGLVLFVAGCAQSDEGTTVNASRTSAPVSSVTSTSPVSATAGPASTAASTQAPPPTPVTLPSAGTVETVAPPPTSARTAFLNSLRAKGIDMDADTAVSLGSSVCRVRKTGGDNAARTFAAPVMKQAMGTEPSDAQVAALVDSSGGLC
ncbi:hypothetical protein [Gordonia polyisoprenivorans]|uniref:hypothetical protein n=1 Tax=Gordonia polyisoprenivorans TaxID=84595 RepID=UPI001AD6E354|nr:hypothetical protein [Gordonia polyisoprenivorans]QTI71068.1 hypothetical protein J6U32_11415 [Gordonia polyisoprenivorans]